MRNHTYYMDIALKEAVIAAEEGEIPVGAVVAVNDDIVARTHNSVIALHDPSAHAEILAIKEAGQKLKDYRLTNARLYVTIEPCIMCAGAAIHARIKQLIFGAYDNKWGAVTLFNVFEHKKLNHRVEVIEGVRKLQASQLLKNFFKRRRI